MPKKDIDPISARLDVIIRLLLERQKKDNKEITIGDHIVFLESTGLEGKDIAKVLGVDVRQLAAYRRSAQKKRKGKEGTSS